PETNARRPTPTSTAPFLPLRPSAPDSSSESFIAPSFPSSAFAFSPPGPFSPKGSQMFLIVPSLPPFKYLSFISSNLGSLASVHPASQHFQLVSNIVPL